jgi:betaine reductase
VARILETEGLPTAQACALTATARAFGSRRPVPAAAIPHPWGRPELTGAEERRWRRDRLAQALASLIRPAEEDSARTETTTGGAQP